MGARKKRGEWLIMKTKAVRLYGTMDLRLEEFELPEMQEDEIIAKVVSDSLCASSYKAAKQGTAHKRVPNDAGTNPVIIGHEFCGEIVEVGSKWADQFKPGDRFIIQPALNYPGRTLDAPGYSFHYIGGDATYVLIPHHVMDMNCLIPYDGDNFFGGSLTEPYSCVIGTFKAMYHTTYGSYVHHMGICEGGNMAMLAGNGPMGQAAIDYIIHCDRRPSLLVVTGRRQEQLDKLASLLTVEDAKANGVELHYFNTSCENPVEELKALTGGKGYDDVLVFAPAAPMVEMGDAILANDGCLNFFSGPSDKDFKALFNFYNVHYASTHIVGTSGGNIEDMKDAVAMMNAGRINPAILVSHVGGLNAVPEATMHLPEIPGPSGKKLIYTGVDMPLTAIDDFEKLGESDPFFKKLDEICKAHNGLWSTEAEKYLLETKSC